MPAPGQLTRGQAVPSADWNTIVDALFGSPSATPFGNWIKVFNVKHPDYGAIGDGVANDTVAIQAARTAAAGGGFLYFPPGTYLYAATDAFAAVIGFWFAPGAKMKIANTFTVTVNGPIFLAGPAAVVFELEGTGNVILNGNPISLPIWKTGGGTGVDVNQALVAKSTLQVDSTTLLKAAATVEANIISKGGELVVQKADATERARLGDGTAGNRGVVTRWDATLAAFRYAYIDNGQFVIDDTEPT